MLRAGALLYAVFISGITTILSAAIILLYFYSEQYSLELSNQNKLVDNVNSAIQLGITKPYGEYVIDLYGEEKDSVIINKRSWGVFDLVVAKSFWKNSEYTKAALIGEYIDNEPTLLLNDNNKSLYVCGNTYVSGDVLLPKSGVKRAYIEGKSYASESLIYGKVSQSEKFLPPFDADKIKELKQQVISAWEDERTIDINDVKDTLSNSFIKQSILIFDDEEIVIENIKISGNIVVQSSSAIVIGASCFLENVILIAPKVSFESGFKGVVQVIASDTVLLSDSVVLNYPSSICLLGDATFPFVQLNPYSLIKGIVFVDNKHLTRGYSPNISIEKKAEIYGQVYCNGAVELKGNIKGSSYVDRFVLKTTSSYYENHLLDVSITRDGFSPSFLGIDIFSNKNKKGIIVCLD
ncbi:MAG: hypothetical protein ACI93N_000011 [Flavobacteriaceae bacterium]|jgi:hypothetical protein